LSKSCPKLVEKRNLKLVGEEEEGEEGGEEGDL
jgi:hypothetical protein